MNFKALALGLTAFALTACGKGGAITVVSDTVASASPSPAVAAAAAPVAESPYHARAATDHFSFCVRSIRLENDEDQAQEMDDLSELVFRPGLINVSSGDEVTWGTVEVPTGFKLKRAVVTVHKDKELCGVDYSVKFNDQTSPQTIHFRFRFDPPVEIAGDEELKLSWDPILAVLRSGGVASLKDRCESAEGRGLLKGKR